MKRLDLGDKNRPVQVFVIPALQDNYIYILRDETNNFTAAVDPSEASPVTQFLDEKGWELNAILTTHFHHDHVGGNEELRDIYDCEVYGLADDAHRLPGVTQALSKDCTFNVGIHECQMMFTPGHTTGNVCYYFPKLGYLFTGDTLFSFGCGRLFEGTPEIMLASLQKIRALPDDTLMFCGHEYTERNLEFAMATEPNSSELKELHHDVHQLRKKNLPTLPVPLAREFALSAFMRWDDPKLKRALGMESASDLETFTEVRRRRNGW